MALIKCVECGKEISDKAASCPHCGCPSQYQQKASDTDDISWDSVYAAIDIGDIIGATKLIKEMTGASLQEARDTAVLIRNNRAQKQKVSSNAYPNTDREAKTIRCLKCGKLYYSDMGRCPECRSITSSTTTEIYIDKAKAPCPTCNKSISAKAESCPYCGRQTGVHVCPKCQSTNTKVISGASKATSIVLWGPFAANKVVSKFQCKDCGHKW